MAQILGLDLGEKRIGVAVSDDSQKIAIPRTILDREPESRLVESLKVLVAETQSPVLVVGLPLSMSGTTGPQAEVIQNMAERLSNALGVTIVFQDERLTSVVAHAVQQSGPVDAQAAALILQTYLDLHREEK